MIKRSIFCALALPLVSSLIAFSSAVTFAAPPPSTSSRLDAIEKRIEADELSDDVYAQLEAIIAKEPTNPKAHLYLGNCYAKLGLPDQAIEEFKLATKYGPNEPKAFVELVKQQIKFGQIPAAMTLLNEAGRKFPKDPEVQFLIASSLIAKGKWDEGEYGLKMAIAKKKKILGLTSALAEIRLMQGNFDEAMKLAKADLEINPKFPMANRIYGLALASTGKFEESIGPLDIAYQATPFKQGLAENLSACAVWAGKWKIALEPSIIALGATASLDSNNPKQKARLYEVMRHCTVNEIELAIKAATIKSGQHPPAAFFFALGDVLDSINMRKFAMEQYTRGLQEAPTYGRAWYRLGKDLEIYSKDYEAALQCYQKAHAFKLQDAEIAMAMYSLSDKLAKRNKDWAWRLKDVLKPPKPAPAIPDPGATAAAGATR
ncbi:MAG: hypothetical protein C0507_02050 [Cyanobacteria bacterium PR.3.49]|nr:hypothetical protein [Cyanobacteria bacterium PR.3.49]